MVTSLDKKWKEVLFSMSGFGPSFLAVVMGAYFSDAVNPAALTTGSVQAISGVCLVLPAVFPILWFIAKIIDGVIDIPLASITDSLTTKFGRRRPPILICFIPMVASFALCWFAIGGLDANANQTLNTIWMCAMAVIYFITYSMSVITFYGSISSVCRGEAQTARVTAYKSFFDTISYCIAYALVPLILKATNLHIHQLVWIMLPLMCTILIPVFIIKEGEKYGYPENRGDVAPEKVGILKSIKVTFSNKLFMKWVLVDCCAMFGLQMFLASMNALILGGMGFDGGQMAIINTAAFAPVPIMLYLLNKLKRKKGLRFAFQTCLISFAICIFSFDIGSLYLLGSDNTSLQMIIGIVGGLFASWAIGSFFMFPYLVPAQVGRVEKQITGQDHSSMFFATRIVATTIMGAFGSSLVYDNIKNLFISKAPGATGIVYATGFNEAAAAFNEKFGLALTGSEVFNFGLLIVPFIVSLACFVGFFLAFRLPKDFSQRQIAEALKAQHPEYDITGVVDEDITDDGTENVFILAALWVLSGSLFGFIWAPLMSKKLTKFSGVKGNTVLLVLSFFIPFVGIAYLLNRNKAMNEYRKSIGLEEKNRTVLFVITGILLPLLPLNVVSQALMEADLNAAIKKVGNK